MAIKHLSSHHSSALMKHRSQHLGFLDSLRGLAALTVIASHYVLSYGLFCTSEWCDGLLSDTPLHFWWDGYAAVSFFFVLSGYVLSLKSFEYSFNWRELYRYWETSYARYLVMRFFRIWLPYLAILLLSAILQKNMPLYTSEVEPSDWFWRFWNDSLSITEYVQEMDLSGWHELTLLPQAWTLSIEIVVSFFVPLGILMLARFPILAIVFTGACLFFQNSVVFIFHFMMGIMLARYYPAIKERLGVSKVKYALLLCLALCAYTFRFSVPVYLEEHFDSVVPESIIWGVTAIGSALLLIVVLLNKTIQKWLLHPFLIGLGKISYSVYLLHFAILLRVTPWVFYVAQTLSKNSIVLWWVGFIATIGISIILAIPSFYWVEQGSIFIGKRVVNKFFKKNDLASLQSS